MPTKVKPRTRADPKSGNGQAGGAVFLCDAASYDLFCGSGYSDLSKNPEILAGVDILARLVASMTIHLMENTDKGDRRLHNELSRKVDIAPNDFMGRFNLVHWTVKTMWLGGRGNAVWYPTVSGELIDQLHPVAPSRVSFQPEGWGYRVVIDGRSHAPDSVIHFAMNPDEERPWLGTGYRVALKDVARNLQRAAKTKGDFLGSKYQPNLIVKVNGLTQEFASPEGRERLLTDYVSTDGVGKPWLIPAGTVDVEQVKPMSLADLALADGVKLDKRTAAAILGMPPFLLGEGEFNQAAWNNFVATRVMHMAQIIQQTLTRSLLYNPKWYFWMNPRSLYSYSLTEISQIVKDCHASGIMTGNEGRDWLGYTPREGLDELVLLENYLPRDRLGDQKKLKGGEEPSKDDS